MRYIRETLKSYKKNYKNIVENKNAYAHRWIAASFDNYLYNKVGSYNQTAAVVDKYKEKYKVFLKKATGFDWAYTRIGVVMTFFPQKELKKYYLYNYIDGLFFERFVSKTEYNKLKEWKQISWCPEAKHWVDTSILTQVFYYKKNKLEKTRIQSLWPNGSHYKHCSCCNSKYKGSTAFHRKLETQVCPRCLSIKVTNDEPNRNRIISGYHSHRNWVFFTQKLKQEKEIGLGLELEVHNRLGNTGAYASKAALHIYEAQKALNKDYNNFYFEWDGSLEDGGFEIITQPMTLSYHKMFWSQMLPKMREVVVGWNAYKLCPNVQNYGIHITFHRNNITEMQLARLLNFHNSLKNGAFLQMIAQRVGGYRSGFFTESNMKFKDIVNMEHKGKLGTGVTKYTNVFVKDGGLIEFRIFRSTLNTQSFFKNIEYVASFLQWISETPYSIKHTDYLEWLIKNPMRLLKYTNLIGFLQRKDIFLSPRDRFNNPVRHIVEKCNSTTHNAANQPHIFANDSLCEDLECA